ncbi:5-methyltetrahydropteroyltriglutamate--homocysteine methyltransferase [Campylobacter upsaliensis]|uniref:5-methyltetrahydropteroyltriglutamate--homocysteine methyltransferase n=1 Tax=Campylobacter upsaliensis TaxID=28080 RepID=A0A381F3R5_CAMUP|nr:5-methyltetrahydropteroyltriglutamate--homocysteine methyltransferase [Campylobacter upsaliensis]
MKNAIISYPRIGANRELKFAIEKYFKKQSTQEELLACAKDLRLDTGERLRKLGLTLSLVMTFLFMIPC